MTIIQDTANTVIVPNIDLSNGNYTVGLCYDICGNQPECMEFLATVCDGVLKMMIEHSCSDPTKLNLGVGTYPIYIEESNISLQKLTLKIYA